MTAVNYGLWYDFRNPTRWHQPFEKFYAERFEQIAAAEELGFGSCWLTEHHFCDDGYTPSPLVIAAAIAARTRAMLPVLPALLAASLLAWCLPSASAEEPPATTAKI